MPKFDKLLCLVGENPLPVYLGVKQMAKERAQVVLVCSAGTRPCAERVARALGDHCLPVLTSDTGISDPHRPTAVARDLERIVDAVCVGGPAEWGLNYTGGTKVMAAYALRRWADADALANTFYLDEGSGCCQLGTGGTEAVTHVLTVAEVCELHGVRKGADPLDVGCTPADLRLLMAARLGEDADAMSRQTVLQNASKTPDKRPPCMIGPAEGEPPEQTMNFDRACNAWRGSDAWRNVVGVLTPDIAMRWFAESSAGPTPKPYPTSLLKARYDFLVRSMWFEHWVKERVREVLGERSPIVAHQKFTIDAQEFEVDLLVVVRQRVYCVSVTTSAKCSEIKEKMMEAARRSEQIGGGMARACVVSLGDRYVIERYDDDGNLVRDDRPTVEDCRASVCVAGRHTIFGLDDVRQWHGGDLRSLRAFLLDSAGN